MIIKSTNNSPAWLRLFGLIYFLISFVINLSALFWIYKLETINCKCSENFMREYIKYFLTIMIPFQTVMFLYLQFYDLEIKSDILIGIWGLLSILNIANIIMSIVYITNLQNNECECSIDKRRTFYFWYKIAMVSLWSLLTIVMPILIIIFGLIWAFVYGIKTAKLSSSKSTSKS